MGTHLLSFEIANTLQRILTNLGIGVGVVGTPDKSFTIFCRLQGESIHHRRGIHDES
jgi:hypothetical protein